MFSPQDRTCQLADSYSAGDSQGPGTPLRESRHATSLPHHRPHKAGQPSQPRVCAHRCTYVHICECVCLCCVYVGALTTDLSLLLGSREHGQSFSWQCFSPGKIRLKINQGQQGNHHQRASRLRTRERILHNTLRTSCVTEENSFFWSLSSCSRVKTSDGGCVP